MERKLLGKSFRKFGYTSRGCPAVFGNLGKCCSTRYWKLPKFKSHLTVWLNWKRPLISSVYWAYKAHGNWKKNWGKIKKQCNSQHELLCSIFRFLFYFCFISTGIHAKWTYLHVLSQTSFFSCYVLTTRLKVHIWLTHMKTRILCIFTPSLHRQRCT